MRLEEIERQGLFLQRMDDTGEWFSYHPLFGSFLRQRCQWELAAELPEIHRAAAESWMEQGFPSEAIHHALAAGDAQMLRDILLNHAWGLFNHSELALLEESLKALPVGKPAGKSAAGVVTGLADAKPTPLQRSEYAAGARRARDQRGHGRHATC
ncbi:HTH-type transcriptional regulator malT [Salmonella enterica subsp. enterica]|nr:HTH-type transcriptional regulator malT [Salmonella enterica subsp. enterica]